MFSCSLIVSTSFSLSTSLLAFMAALVIANFAAPIPIATNSGRYASSSMSTQKATSAISVITKIPNTMKGNVLLDFAVIFLMYYSITVI